MTADCVLVVLNRLMTVVGTLNKMVFVILYVAERGLLNTTIWFHGPVLKRPTRLFCQLMPSFSS